MHIAATEGFFWGRGSRRLIKRIGTTIHEQIVIMTEKEAIIAIHQSFTIQFELESSERCWQWSTSMTELRNCMPDRYSNKTFTYLDSYLHNFAADRFLFNHSLFHWSFSCIERSIETVMVYLKHSWTEHRGEIMHSKAIFLVRPRKPQDLHALA